MDFVPAVFFSYARADDKSEDGRLSQLRERLETELRAISGEAWDVFQDKEDIDIGQQWRKRLSEGVAGSTFFVPIITPTYLRREICREELEQFLQREKLLGRDDLVIPILYLDTPELSDPQSASSDSLAVTLSQRNYDDWQSLRRTSLKSVKVSNRITKLAKAILAANKRKHSTAGPSVNPELPVLPRQVTSARAFTSDELLERVCSSDEAELVSDLLLGRWTLSQLEEAIDSKQERAFQIVDSVARAGGQTWNRLIVAFAASRVEVPPDRLVGLAFYEKLHWGSRFPPLACLRFIPASKRDGVARCLFEAVEKQPLGKHNFDNERLAIYGFGFLGRNYSVRSIMDTNLALQDKYANEKLGPSAVLAYLHCYLEITNESMTWDALDDFTRSFNATTALGNLGLGFFDYSDEVQCLRPGKAVRLFRHFRDNGHETPLTAVLTAIGHRPNPLLLDELIDLGTLHSDTGVSAGALHAASYIGTATAEKRLRSCMERNLPGAKAAWLLAIGLSKNLSAVDEIASVIQDTQLPRDASWHGIRHNAIWAAGELGRVNPDFAKSVLDAVRGDAHDPYGRALAWLGLGKAGHVSSQAECQAAFESASNFFERMIVAVASSLAGWPDLLIAGIAGTIQNHAPLYRLLAHIERDVRIALQAHAGEGGKALVTLLDLGDFT